MREPESLKLEVVHEADAFVVVNKPSGLLSVPGKGEAKQTCVASRVRAMFPRAAGPMVVHRLDMDTSGLMVVALTPDAQRELSGQFERREVDKAYVAILQGSPARDHGLIDLPMRTDIDDRPRQIIDFIFGKPSQTRYQILARDALRTRVRFEPMTGRSHQLRVHAAAPASILRNDGVWVEGGLACPIVGDALYGDASSGERLMLHASELALTDPTTGQRVRFDSAAPW
jgi:tRNA pseudouridine32 synthase/23S rRNA pseudouridine746 synthase